MRKLEFLTSLGAALSGLPQEDIDRSLEYYSEMLDDRIEDGADEEEAVAAMGSPEEVARQILMDTPLPKLVRARVKPARTLRAWEIVLLIVGAPLWFPLLCAAASTLLSLYIAAWSVIVSLYAADLSLAVSFLVGLLRGGISFFTGAHLSAAFYLGAGLACAGLSILLFFLVNKLAGGLIYISKRFLLWIKSLFIKRRSDK